MVFDFMGYNTNNLGLSYIPAMVYKREASASSDQVTRLPSVGVITHNRVIKCESTGVSNPPTSDLNKLSKGLGKGFP